MHLRRADAAISDGDRAEFVGFLVRRAVWPVFQPVVDVFSGEVLGVEALARGPADSRFADPAAMFAAAGAAGLVGELDELCRERAMEDAEDAGLAGPFTLFVNAEPLSACRGFRAPPSAARLMARGVRIVVEITERDLTGDPARLLRFAAEVRNQGLRIALDDVGADPASLALMPFLAPEVVKLDLSVVQGNPGPVVAEIMSAVAAYAEECDAVVVAEGVENLDHLEVARGLGATLAQGWHFGYPQPAAALAGLRRPRSPMVLRGGHPLEVPDSPYSCVARVRPPRSGHLALLAQVSSHLERQAAEQNDLAVVLATFEDAGNFSTASRQQYTDLARHAAFVAVLARGVDEEPVPGVRGADLHPGDPVAGEWNLAVVGPHFAAALVARDLAATDGDDPRSADPDRPFTYVLTHDRGLVLQVARSLMARVLPRSTTAGAPAPAGRSGSRAVAVD